MTLTKQKKILLPCVLPRAPRFFPLFLSLCVPGTFVNLSSSCPVSTSPPRWYRVLLTFSHFSLYPSLNNIPRTTLVKYNWNHHQQNKKYNQDFFESNFLFFYFWVRWETTKFGHGCSTPNSFLLLFLFLKWEGLNHGADRVWLTVCYFIL